MPHTGTSVEGICNLLIVINSNHGPILLRYWDTAAERSKNSENCVNEAEMAVQGHVMVIDFGTSGQGIYDFLLVINSNYCQGNVIAGQRSPARQEAEL